MARKPTIRNSIFPYHVYNRCIDRQFYPVSFSELWDECSDLLRILTWAFGFRIHAFVLMSNHYHMLVTTPENNLPEGMMYFQSELSRWLVKNTLLQRFRFSSRYKECLITDSSYYANALRYIAQNPIRAGICKRSEDYPFSILSARHGFSGTSCPPFEASRVFPLFEEGDFQAELEFCNDWMYVGRLQGSARDRRGPLQARVWNAGRKNCLMS